MSSTTTKGQGSNLRLWKCLTVIFIIISFALIVALIVVFIKDDEDDDVRACGGGRPGQNDDVIDLSEPSRPGPFHDLTSHELKKLRIFLERDRTTKAFKAEAIGMDSSAIFAADLYLPPKADVLRFLDGKGPQPPRRARVMLLRGDLPTPVIEEYICGPLPNVGRCELLDLPKRRNPIQYSLRPFSATEFGNIRNVLLVRVDEELEQVLLESYGTRFTACDENGLCLHMIPSPVGTGILGNIDQRRMWITATYKVEHRTSHALNFGLLVNLDSHNVSKWSIDRIWYAGKFYNSTQELLHGYTSNSIPKANVTKPSLGDDLVTRQTLKGDPWPDPPKRAPQLVEPDGKRYKIKDRKVEYMDWSFNFRLSSFTGAALNDVRFKGERIVYDMGLQELSVLYSGFAPMIQTTNYMDSGLLLGTNSKALVAGGDCPDTATFINQKFMAQTSSQVAEFRRAMCIFENNQGFPLRRHLTYSKYLTSVYTGMLNSALTFRTAMTMGNYDYVLDYIFHQNGVLETRWMSTGYVLTAFYSNEESGYSFPMPGYRGAPLHHHLAHFKVDLDVSGTSNRYETLDVEAEDVPLTMDPSVRYQSTHFKRSLKATELESVYQYDFDHPKVHVIHNDKVKNHINDLKAYRIDVLGTSKQLRHKRKHNEVSIPWARNQMVMTSQKDDEFWSSSSYAMWDSADPVVDFSAYYTDNDNITDQDIVAWITLGMHHIPRLEDFPVTTTVGTHRTFLLMPFNYFPQCPSVRSTDAVRMTHKDPLHPELGIRLNRHGNPTDQCAISKPDLEDVIDKDPDSVFETAEDSPIF